MAGSLTDRSIFKAKRAVYEGCDVHLQAGLEIEGDAFIHTALTDEAVSSMHEYVDSSCAQRIAWRERKNALLPPAA